VAPGPKIDYYYFKTRNAAREFRLRIKRWDAHGQDAIVAH
jgi:hypothetical protein